jgi:hypothetical protein
LQITFAIQDGRTKTNSSSKGTTAATAVEENGCQFNQNFGNGAYALTSSYGTRKGMSPARGKFLVNVSKDYVGK